MNKLVTKPDITFSLPAISADKINSAAVAKVNKCLPEIAEKTRAFDRKNSQTSLSLMTLTMMTGQSPFRMMRQVMSEIETRKIALAEAQVTHAEILEELGKLEDKHDAVSLAKFRHKTFSLDMMESKINGSFKDIAILIDAYEKIKAKNNIDEWDEVSFEAEESRFHVRRGFELMYRNLLDGSRAQTATIEYTAQYGVHPQVCLTEVSGYIQLVAQIISEGNVLHSNHLEDFLDEMADKYTVNVTKTSERIFGQTDFTNIDYMHRIQVSKGD